MPKIVALYPKIVAFKLRNPSKQRGFESLKTFKTNIKQQQQGFLLLLNFFDCFFN